MGRELKSVTIAKITKIFGGDGSVVLRLYDSFPDEVNFKEPLFVLTDGLATPLFFNSFQRRGKDKALVCFDDIDTPYRATLIVGCEAVAFEDRDQDEELYYEDMVGFRLIDNGSGRVGEITEYQDSENNPLFYVIMDGVEVIVPVADELIEEIDEDGESITMRLPEGLVDLYLNPDDVQE